MIVFVIFFWVGHCHILLKVNESKFACFCTFFFFSFEGDPKPTVNILAASTAIDNQGNQDRSVSYLKQDRLKMKMKALLFV